MARRQFNGSVQQLRARQAAQTQAHAVQGGIGADDGTQIGPGFAQLVFVQRRQIALRLNAFAHHHGGGLRQPAVALGVAPRTGIKLELKIHHGQIRDFHQIHPGTVVQHPKLNRYAGHGRRQQQA